MARRAALNSILGRERILRFFVDVARRADTPVIRGTYPRQVNQLPGFLVRVVREYIGIEVEAATTLILEYWSPDQLPAKTPAVHAFQAATCSDVCARYPLKATHSLMAARSNSFVRYVTPKL